MGCMAWSTNCSLLLVGRCARMISWTWRSQPAQKHVWTCSSGVIWTGKQLQGGTACTGNQAERMLRQHHPELQISGYVMLSRCSRTLNSGCSLSLPACLLVLFCFVMDLKEKAIWWAAVQEFSRCILMGLLWEFINILNLMYVFEAACRCVTANNNLILGISV